MIGGTLIGELKSTLLASPRAVRDVLLSMLPQAACFVSGFMSSILIARGLGPAGLGEYALILSISGLLGAVSDLGVGQTAIRYASRAASAGDEAALFAVLRWALRIRLLLVLAATLVFYVIIPALAENLWSMPELVPWIRLGLLAGIISVLTSIPVTYFQAIQRFRSNAVVQVAQYGLSLAAVGILAVMQWWSVPMVLIASLASTSAAAGAFLTLVPREALAAPRGQGIRGLRDFLRPPSPARVQGTVDDSSIHAFAFWMLLSSVLVMVTLRLDVWLMGYFLDKDQIGLYNVATRFTIPLTMLLAALNTALWPRASSALRPDQIRPLLRKTFVASGAMAALSAAYSLSAPLLTGLLFGREYAAATVLAQVLCLRYCVSMVSNPVGIVGFSLGLARVYWIVNFIQFAAVAAVNVVMLPRMGPMASAMALIANELLGAAAVGILVLRRWKAMSTRYPEAG
jgi:O-antigen/teichoic acid export membrane protein